mgnify:FL=1|jgi:hypothetical protein
MKYIYIATASLFFPAVLSAQGIQFDKRAIDQVEKNSAAALSSESLIQKSMEKAKKAQEVINKYTTIVQANLDEIHRMQQDVSDFRSGTKAMKELSSLLGKTLYEIKLLGQDIVHYPKGALVYHSSFNVLYKETIGIGSKVLTIVSDGKGNLSSVPSAQVARNLLSPTKRLEVFNRCIYELERVWTMARHIRIGIQLRNTTKEVALELTTSAALSADLLSQIKDDVIRLWQRDY